MHNYDHNPVSYILLKFPFYRREIKAQILRAEDNRPRTWEMSASKLVLWEIQIILLFFFFSQSVDMYSTFMLEGETVGVIVRNSLCFIIGIRIY